MNCAVSAYLQKNQHLLPLDKFPRTLCIYSQCQMSVSTNACRPTNHILHTQNHTVQWSSLIYGDRIESLRLCQDAFPIEICPSMEHGVALVVPREVVEGDLGDAELTGRDEGDGLARSEVVGWQGHGHEVWERWITGGRCSDYKILWLWTKSRQDDPGRLWCLMAEFRPKSNQSDWTTLL